MVTIYKSRREDLEETNPTDDLTSDFSLQDCEKINVCCLTCPVSVLCYGSLSELNTVVNKNLLNKGTPLCHFLKRL